MRLPRRIRSRELLGLAMCSLVILFATGGSASAQAPPNDDFANAFAIPSQLGVGSVPGDNLEATGETGEPDHAGASQDASEALASVWYRWTAPQDAVFEIDTCTSDFDTTLAVYVGTSVGALTPLGSSDDDCEVGDGSGSALSGTASAGTTYYIAVDGFEDAQGTFTLSLSASPAPDDPPPDDPPSDDPPSTSTSSGTAASSPTAPAPAPAPAAGFAPSQAPADTTAPAAAVTTPRQRLRTALSKGTLVRVQMSEAGRACATLRLASRAARRLGLRPAGSSGVVVGNRCMAFATAGTRGISVKFTAKSARALRKLVRAGRGVSLTLRVVATDAAGNRRIITRTLRLRS